MTLDNTLKILGFILLVFTFSGQHAMARESMTDLATTHPQVAAVLNQMKSFYSLTEFEKQWHAKSLYGDQVNVHDFEPTIKDLKILRKQSNLIAGPTGDQRWLIGAKAKGLLPKDTLFIEFPNLNNDHFWLFSKGGCAFEKQVNSFLKAKALLKEPKTPYCDWIVAKSQEISELLKKSHIERVVLAHSALRPLLKDCGLEVLTLMQHDHDKEVSPKTLKKLSTWLKDKKPILAIKEEGFPTPHQLVGSKLVVTLEWSPLQTRPQPLESLLSELKKALQ